MSNIIFFNSYKLKKGVSVQDFLVAAETLNQQYISKQKGFVSFKLMVDDATWADATTFETMEDAKRFAECGDPNELAETFYSFLNLSTCRSNFFSVEKEW